MPDEPESSKQTPRNTTDKKRGGSVPSEVKRGDELDMGGRRAIVYSILYDADSEPGPEGYQVGVVFLEDNRGMASNAKWSEDDRCWRFLEDEIPRDARPALDSLVQKLRFKRVK